MPDETVDPQPATDLEEALSKPETADEAIERVVTSCHALIAPLGETALINQVMRQLRAHFGG